MLETDLRQMTIDSSQLEGHKVSLSISVLTVKVFCFVYVDRACRPCLRGFVAISHDVKLRSCIKAVLNQKTICDFVSSRDNQYATAPI